MSENGKEHKNGGGYDANTMFIIGRLTADPEIRMAKSQKQYCRFTIANNQTVKNVDGDEQTTIFLRCTAFDRLAVVVGEYCKKGRRVALVGRLQQSSWNDGDGVLRREVSMIVNSLQLL